MNPLGTVPDKGTALDFYSDGVCIVDAANSYKCPVLWLNTICKEMIGKSTCTLQSVGATHADAGVQRTFLYMFSSSNSCLLGPLLLLRPVHIPID